MGGAAAAVLRLKYAWGLIILRVNPVLDLAAVNQVLSSLIDPNTGHDFVSSRSARNVRIDRGDSVSLDVELGYPAKSQIPALRKALIGAARSVPGVENVGANLPMLPELAPRQP